MLIGAEIEKKSHEIHVPLCIIMQIYATRKINLCDTQYSLNLNIFNED